MKRKDINKIRKKQKKFVPHKIFRSKKAQIKIFESIAVLLIFMFLIAIGAKFYTTTQMQSLKEAQRKISKLDSIKTAVELISLPELACINQGVFDTTCIDGQKLDAWVTLINEDPKFKDFYYRTLGQSQIVIERIYPKRDTKNKFTIYNYTDNSKNSDHVMVPTSLYWPNTGKKQLAIINIKTFYN